MNKKLIKNIAIFILVPTAITIGYVGVKYYIKKKNEPSDDKLDELIKLFSKKDSDVFTGMNEKIYKKIALPNFKNNVTKEEVDEAIAIGNKNEEEWTEDDKTKLLVIFPKILGATNVNAMGFDSETIDNDIELDKYAKNLQKNNPKSKWLWL